MTEDIAYHLDIGPGINLSACVTVPKSMGPNHFGRNTGQPGVVPAEGLDVDEPPHQVQPTGVGGHHGDRLGDGGSPDRRLARSPFRYDGATLTFSASAGVTSTLSGDTPETVRKRADSALYEAKRQGRGRWMVSKDEGMKSEGAEPREGA